MVQDGGWAEAIPGGSSPGIQVAVVSLDADGEGAATADEVEAASGAGGGRSGAGIVPHAGRVGSQGTHVPYRRLCGPRCVALGLCF